MALAPAGPGLSGVPSSVRAQKRDPLSVPLVRFDPPLRYVPATPVRSLSGHGQLSWALFPLQRIQEARVHVPPASCRAPLPRPEGLGRFHSRFPHRLLRGRSQVFSTSQRLYSSHHHPPIFRQVALMGLRSPGVYSPCVASSNSSPPEYPLGIFPFGCAVPSPGSERRWAHVANPRFLIAAVSFFAFRVFVRARFGRLPSPL
jgi:hypothetical protein